MAKRRKKKKILNDKVDPKIKELLEKGKIEMSVTAASPMPTDLDLTPPPPVSRGSAGGVGRFSASEDSRGSSVYYSLPSMKNGKWLGRRKRAISRNNESEQEGGSGQAGIPLYPTHIEWFDAVEGGSGGVGVGKTSGSYAFGIDEKIQEAKSELAERRKHYEIESRLSSIETHTSVIINMLIAIGMVLIVCLYLLIRIIIK